MKDGKKERKKERKTTTERQNDRKKGRLKETKTETDNEREKGRATEKRRRLTQNGSCSVVCSQLLRQKQIRKDREYVTEHNERPCPLFTTGIIYQFNSHEDHVARTKQKDKV